VDPDQKMEETDSETGSRQRQQSERVTAIRKELSALDQSQMPIAYKLLKDELDYQLQEAGKRVSPPENPEYVRVDDKIVRLSQKIIVPVERDPEFNFVGKIVGKKGANMRQISSETNVRLSIKVNFMIRWTMNRFRFRASWVRQDPFIFYLVLCGHSFGRRPHTRRFPT
jgi:hypothetical protein